MFRINSLQSCSLLALGMTLVSTGYIRTGVIVPPRARLQEPDSGHYFEKPGKANIESKQNLSLPVDYGHVKSSSELDGLATMMVRASPRAFLS